MYMIDPENSIAVATSNFLPKKNCNKQNCSQNICANYDILQHL